jgi:hypothetical protein
MAAIGDLATPRRARPAPVPGRLAKPSTRDQQDLARKFAEVNPARIGAIIGETERGVITEWADLCDRMVFDPTVKAAYETRLSAVSATRWVIEPGDATGDPARDRYREDARAFVERVIATIGLVDPPTDYREIGDFRQGISNLLDGIGKGLGATEIEWRYVSGDWVPARLHWVHARRFCFSTSWEPLLVDAGDTYNSSGVTLEPGKFLVHMPRPVAGYPTKTGAMRSVVWAWLFKKWGQQFWLSGAERFAWPFMWALVDRNTPKEMRAEHLARLEKLAADHAAVLDAGTEVKLLESTVKDGGTWKEFNAAMSGEISKGIQGMADASEASKVGAYGAVEARKGISIDPRIAVDEAELASTVQRQLIWWICWFNRHRFGGLMPPVPFARWAIAGAPNQIPDQQRTTVLEIVGAVERGERTPEAAVLMITILVPSIDRSQAEAIVSAAARKAAPGPEAVDEEEALSELDVEAGTTWTDTEDGHRLEVTRVSGTHVYYRDLDGENPARQYRWVRASFLERCTPAAPEPAKP